MGVSFGAREAAVNQPAASRQFCDIVTNAREFPFHGDYKARPDVVSLRTGEFRMKLFDVLRTIDPELTPDDCKIHLASSNGIDDPLDVYLEGKFDDWQAWQTKRNFERRHVVALIQLRARNRWLFAGTHDAKGCSGPNERGCFRYQMKRRDGGNPLDGRLVIEFERTGRNSYLRAENWLDAMRVAEIRPEKMVVMDFPGFSATLLSKRHLDIVVRQRADTWRSALEHVAGVYVIADKSTGKLYIGSATGAEGIWCRWCAYSATGHGGNAELRELLREKGPDHASNFQFGILEVAGTHGDDVQKREAHWKDLLLTRTYGLNSN